MAMKFLYAAALAAMLTVAGAANLRAQEPEPDKEKQKQEEEEKKKKPQPKPDDKAKPEPKPDKEKAKPDARASQDRNSQRGNNANTKRIPDDRYHANFGREHHFRVARGSDRRFAYGGFAFEYVDAWPAGWSPDDECYIVLDGDDYYLVDVVHPELRIRVVIVG